jgi:hypothetical protein
MFYKFFAFACLCFQPALASREPKTPPKVKKSRFCNRVDGCPTISTLNQSVYALEAAFELQVEINSDLIAQLTFMQYEIGALFNSTSNPYGPPSSVLPYNETTCRAIPYTNYTNDAVRGWVFFGKSGSKPFSDTCSIQFNTAPTCAQICAQKGQKCDPCGMSKLNCQNAVYWAAQQTKLSLQGLGSLTMLNRYPPYIPGPWEQSVCANATYDGNADGIPRGYTNLPGITFMEAVCPQTPGGQGLLATSWSAPKNYYDKNGFNYIDPSTLCDLPVATTTGETGLQLVTFSTACYCTR